MTTINRKGLEEIASSGLPSFQHIAKLVLEVNEAILNERLRQNDKWGHQRHTMETWLTILIEEVGEAAQAMQTEKGWGKPSDASDLYEELIHVSAVASAMAEQVLEERRMKG